MFSHVHLILSALVYHEKSWMRPKFSFSFKQTAFIQQIQNNIFTIISQKRLESQPFYGLCKSAPNLVLADLFTELCVCPSGLEMKCKFLYSVLDHHILFSLACRYSFDTWGIDVLLQFVDQANLFCPIHLWPSYDPWA
jgi:hypothetical protein